MKTTKQQLTRVFRTLGGAGSGNFGHAGRPGEVGGSTSSGDSFLPGSMSTDQYFDMIYSHKSEIAQAKALYQAAGVKPEQVQLVDGVMHRYFSDDCSLVNHALRFKGVMGKEQQLMNQVVSNAGPFANKQDTVYRGLYFPQGEGQDFLKGLVPGNTISDRGFQSTSIERKVASDFALLHEESFPLPNRSGDRVMLTITGAKGAGMLVPRFMNDEFEKEVLLPAGTAYRIEKVTQVRGEWNVKVSVVKGRGKAGVRGNAAQRSPRRRKPTFAERMANPEGLVVEAV